MNTVRLNITLPFDVAESIKEIKNKSAYIADALEQKIAKEKQEKLIALLEEGYQATKEEDRELISEWDCVSGDGIN